MSTKSTKSSKLPPSLIGRLGQVLTDPARASQHQPIGPYTSAGVGGVAEHLVVVESLAELLAVLTVAVEEKVPYLLLGGGSNVLASSVGYPGLVIINRARAITFLEPDGEVLVESGTSNETLANLLASRGFTGLEHLAVIPGTIGGAVASDAEWGERHLSDFLREAIVFVPDSGKGETTRVSAEELWANRRQFFSDTQFGPVMLSLRFRLRRFSEEEARRRLAEVRRLGALDRQMIMGGIFTPLPPVDLWSDGRKLVPRGLSVDRRRPNILRGRRGEVEPEKIRSAVDDLERHLAQAGYQGERRLRYIGYWPQEENNVTSSPDA